MLRFMGSLSLVVHYFKPIMVEDQKVCVLTYFPNDHFSILHRLPQLYPVPCYTQFPVIPSSLLYPVPVKYGKLASE